MKMVTDISSAETAGGDIILTVLVYIIPHVIFGKIHEFQFTIRVERPAAADPLSRRRALAQELVPQR
jgi:hypothetical protein